MCTFRIWENPDSSFARWLPNGGLLSSAWAGAILGDSIGGPKKTANPPVQAVGGSPRASHSMMRCTQPDTTATPLRPATSTHQRQSASKECRPPYHTTI